MNSIMHVYHTIDQKDNRKKPTGKTNQLLAVLKYKIQPPTIIQKEGNYIFLQTYTFTIDIFPLVLENQCFAGHKHN